MRDSYKIALLIVGCLGIIGWFLMQGLTADNYAYFLSRRIPKILAIILAAVAISASSLVFQTITNNRILTPSILGFDSLYLMIQVTLVVTLGSTSHWVVNALNNFVLSTSIMIGFSLLLFYFYFKRQSNNIFTLLLLGIVCGSLFGSLTNFMTLLVDPNDFAALQSRLFASFNNVNSALVYWSLIPLSICISALLYLAPRLDVLWLGKDNATSLGINTQKLNQQVMVLVTLLVALSTALVGPVLFFGLITVSLTRELFNHYQHRLLIIASSLLAVLLLVSGQWFVEKILTFQTTISVIINLVGGSYFLLLLLKNRVN